MHVKTAPTHPMHASGIALVIVLWVVVLLTIIVTSFVYSARGQMQLVGNRLSRLQAQALADAGIHRALYEIHKPEMDAERWKADGRSRDFEYQSGQITVTIVDETAYIDLNTAPVSLLKGLLLSLGVEEGKAAQLLDAILDWRDQDNLVRQFGAEREQYAAAGLGYGPGNADFRLVSELKSVLGMTPELYEKLSGALTVYSHSTGINAGVAPRQVLLAIPGLTQEAVDGYLSARDEALAQGLNVPAFPPAAAFLGAGAGVYNIRSVGKLSDGTAFSREAVVRVVADPKHPITYLDWREGRP